MRSAVYRFFHDSLPDKWERGLYDAIELCLEARETETYYPNTFECSADRVFSVAECVYNDHPEFYFLDLQRCTIRINTLYVIFIPKYRYSREQQLEFERKIEAVRDAVLTECFPQKIGDYSELEREKKIFDWIASHIEYDHSALKGIRDDLAEADSSAWNVYGALVLRKGVCHGIACAFKYLCDSVDLPSIVVCGETTEGRHAWNIVRVSKRFYHVDCTWDLRSSVSFDVPYARYRYFNLPDRIIWKNHTPEIDYLPRCVSAHDNPFFLRGFAAKNRVDLRPVIWKHIQDGCKRFAILCLYFDLTQAEADEISQEIAARINCTVTYDFDSSGSYIGFRLPESKGTRRIFHGGKNE